MYHNFYTNGSYSSPQRQISWLAKRYPSLVFYQKYLKVVFKSAKLAKAGLYDNERWCQSSYELLEALESVGVRFTVTGATNFLELKEPCVFVGNHMSSLETVIMPCLISPYKEITFVVKESLLHYPVFKHVMRSRHPIAVTRTNAREDFVRVMQGGVKKLQEGLSIVIFPQTTRTTLFDPSQFTSIAVKLAKKANVPVVPFALKTDAWQNGKRLKDFGRIDPSVPVYFHFGSPFYITAKDTEENARIISFIEKCLQGWM